jgi:hypothetical protein
MIVLHAAGAYGQTRMRQDRQSARPPTRPARPGLDIASAAVRAISIATLMEMSDMQFPGRVIVGLLGFAEACR